MSDMPALDSLRDKVAARRAELQRSRTQEFDVPGYEGVLRARYRLLDYKETRRIGERINRLRDVDDFTRELYAAADTIVVACEDVLYQPNGNGEWVSTGQRWTPELVHSLGIPDPTTPRQAIFALMSNDRLIARHFAQINEWMEGVAGEVDADVVGESVPPRPSN